MLAFDVEAAGSGHSLPYYGKHWFSVRCGAQRAAGLVLHFYRIEKYRVPLPHTGSLGNVFGSSDPQPRSPKIFEKIF